MPKQALLFAGACWFAGVLALGASADDSCGQYGGGYGETGEFEDLFGFGVSEYDEHSGGGYGGPIQSGLFFWNVDHAVNNATNSGDDGIGCKCPIYIKNIDADITITDECLVIAGHIDSESTITLKDAAAVSICKPDEEGQSTLCYACGVDIPGHNQKCDPEGEHTKKIAQMVVAASDEQVIFSVTEGNLEINVTESNISAINMVGDMSINVDDADDDDDAELSGEMLYTYGKLVVNADKADFEMIGFGCTDVSNSYFTASNYYVNTQSDAESCQDRPALLIDPIACGTQAPEDLYFLARAVTSNGKTTPTWPSVSATTLHDFIGYAEPCSTPTPFMWVFDVEFALNGDFMNVFNRKDIYEKGDECFRCDSSGGNPTSDLPTFGCFFGPNACPSDHGAHLETAYAEPGCYLMPNEETMRKSTVAHATFTTAGYPTPLQTKKAVKLLVRGPQTVDLGKSQWAITGVDGEVSDTHTFSDGDLHMISSVGTVDIARLECVSSGEDLPRVDTIEIPLGDLFADNAFTTFTDLACGHQVVRLCDQNNCNEGSEPIWVKADELVSEAEASLRSAAADACAFEIEPRAFVSCGKKGQTRLDAIAHVRVRHVATPRCVAALQDVKTSHETTHVGTVASDPAPKPRDELADALDSVTVDGNSIAPRKARSYVVNFDTHGSLSSTPNDVKLTMSSAFVAITTDGVVTINSQDTESGSALHDVVVRITNTINNAIAANNRKAYVLPLAVYYVPAHHDGDEWQTTAFSATVARPITVMDSHVSARSLLLESGEHADVSIEFVVVDLEHAWYALPNDVVLEWFSGEFEVDSNNNDETDMVLSVGSTSNGAIAQKTSCDNKILQDLWIGCGPNPSNVAATIFFAILLGVAGVAVHTRRKSGQEYTAYKRAPMNSKSAQSEVSSPLRGRRALLPHLRM